MVECCCSGSEVGTCPPDWDKWQNQPPMILIFEGSDGEDTAAYLPWANGGHSLAEHVVYTSHHLTCPLTPLKRKIAAEHYHSVSKVATHPPDLDKWHNHSPQFSFSRIQTRKGLLLTCPGLTVDLPGQSMQIALLITQLNHLLCQKWKLCWSTAILGLRWGHIPLTWISDGIILLQFLILRGRQLCQ